MFRSLVLLCLIAFHPLVGANTSNDVIVIDKNLTQSKIDISRYASYFLAPYDTDIESIDKEDLWIKNGEEMMNFAYTKDAAFIKLKVKNNTSETVSRIFSVDFPLIDVVDFYEGYTKLYASGDMRPFDERPVDASFIGFPIEVGPNEEKTLHLVVDTRAGLQIPLFMHTLQSFYSSEAMLLGIMFSLGVASIIICTLTLALAFSNKSKEVLNIFWMSVSICIFTASYYAFPYRYIFEDVESNHALLIIGISLFMWAVGSFNRNLYLNRLQFIKISGSLDVFSKGVKWIGFVTFVVYLIVGYEGAVMVSYMGTLMVFYGCLFLYWPYRKILPFGRWYMATWLTLGILSSVSGFADGGILIGPYYWHLATIVYVMIVVAMAGLAYTNGLVDKKSLDKTLEKLERRTVDQMIQEKSVMMGNLVGGLNHEVNTPLGTIRLTLESVETSCIAGKDDEDSRELQALINSGKNAVESIDKILIDMKSIAQTDNLYEGIERFNLKDMLAGIKSLNPEVQINLTGVEKDMEIQGAQSMIGQLFMNLHSNSVDAMENNDEKIIEVYTKRLGNHVKITWRDNGAGIKEENLKKVFDAFYTTKGVNKGTGLGLSNCLSIVKLHGGKMMVESELGKYTEFTIELPMNLTAKV